MNHVLTPTDLRDLAGDPVLLRLLGVLADETDDLIGTAPLPDMLGARLILGGIVTAAKNAAAADPGCWFCKGSGVVTFPDGHGAFSQFYDDDADVSERTCPVCRPWPTGFPGFHARAHGDNGSFNMWVVAPYGPRENVDTKRDVAPPPGHVPDGRIPEPF